MYHPHCVSIYQYLKITFFHRARCENVSPLKFSAFAQTRQKIEKSLKFKLHELGLHCNTMLHTLKDFAAQFNPSINCEAVENKSLTGHAYYISFKGPLGIGNSLIILLNIMLLLCF